jgi:hypothetical protein
MAGMMRVPRSRGAFSGVLLILLGIWGGLVPLLGPYVHYAYTPDRAWAWSSGRLWLEILPAAGTLLGGIVVFLSRLRPFALFGAMLAVLSGAWFAFGSTLVTIWNTHPPTPGSPVGGPVARAFEQIGFFTGLGVVIVLVAAIALGRLAVISSKDMKAAARPAPTPKQAVAPTASGPDADTDTGSDTPTKRGWRLVGRTGAGKVSTGS